MTTALPLTLPTSTTPATPASPLAPAGTSAAPDEAIRFVQALQRAGVLPSALAMDTLPVPGTDDTPADSAEVAEETAGAIPPPSLLPALWMSALAAPAPQGNPAADAAPAVDSAMPVAAGLATSTSPLAAAGRAAIPAPALVATGQPVPSEADAAAPAPTLASRPPAAATHAAALSAGHGLSPEAAAVRERSMLASSALRTSDMTGAPALAPEPAPASPVHATTTAARAPQSLVDALGERIDVQLQRGSDRAVIRLDPPMQGQLEITIRRDAGAIQVHLSATHGDVVKQLQAISDSLRHDLGNRQSGDVTVVVSQHMARDGDGRGRPSSQAPEKAEPGQALAEAEDGQAPARFALSTSTY